MSVVIYSADLMVISTISGTAQQFGRTTVTVSTPADFLARAPADVQIVFLDLNAAGKDAVTISELVRSLKSHAPYCKLVAFGPHVHDEQLAAAVDAGCDKVLTRGQFMRDVNVMLGQGVF